MRQIPVHLTANILFVCQDEELFEAVIGKGTIRDFKALDPLNSTSTLKISGTKIKEATLAIFQS